MKYADAYSAWLELSQLLQERNPFVEFHIAGSLRRKCSEVNDLDIVAVCPVDQAFPNQPEKRREEHDEGPLVLSHIDKSLRTSLYPVSLLYTFDWQDSMTKFNPAVSPIKVDIRCTVAKAFGGTLAWLTGPRTFGDILNACARRYKQTFGPDGLKEINFAMTEREVLRYLVGQWIEPVDRERWALAQRE